MTDRHEASSAWMTSPIGPLELAAFESLAKTPEQEDGTPGKPDFVRAFAAFEWAGSVPFNVLAFQSGLWNLMVSFWLTAAGTEGFWTTVAGLRLHYARRRPAPLPRVMLPSGETGVDPRSELRLPSPGRRTPPDWMDELEKACKILRVTPEQIVQSPLDDKLFDHTTRPIWTPIEGDAAAIAPDTLYEGRSAVTLKFLLPPGAYATMAIKPLQAADEAVTASLSSPEAPKKQKAKPGRRERAKSKGR
jgi:hypothetical protein